MLNLQRGDQVEIIFVEDTSADAIRGTVARILTDQEAGMGAEVQDYIACWAEVAVDDPGDGPVLHIIELGTDFQVRLNGRPVNLRKRDA